MAKPKLCLIPATVGDKVYSILPSNGVGDFDFTRADGSSPTGVTRINAQGLIEEVASGENRLNYSLLDGEVVGCPHLLLEPSRTNLETKSNGFSTWSVNSNITRTANYIVSPDGTQNATRLQFTANGYMGNTTQTNSTQYTVSCYAKRNDSGTQNVGFFTNGSGVVNSAWSITSEWKRFTYTYTSGNASFVGIAGVSGADISVFGFQIEAASYPTSYIKTTSAAVTRAAETCNGSGDAATFNDSEGVLMAEISALADDLTNRAITISDKTSNNRIFITYYAQSNGLFSQIISNGVIQATLTAQLPSIKNSTKVLVKYKQNDFALWVNGFEVSSDEIGVTPIGLDDLSFDRGTGTLNFYGKTKQIQYFDTTDIDLEQLTSWDSFRDMAQAQLYSVE